MEITPADLDPIARAILPCLTVVVLIVLTISIIQLIPPKRKRK